MCCLFVCLFLYQARAIEQGGAVLPVALDNNESAPIEGIQELQQLFLKFTGPAAEMDSRTFVKLCKDCHLTSKSFTTIDADLIFMHAKAAASSPSAGSYSSGVVHGKKVNFDVFRGVAIPLVAAKTGKEVSDLVLFLAGQLAA